MKTSSTNICWFDLQGAFIVDKSWKRKFCCLGCGEHIREEHIPTHGLPHGNKKLKLDTEQVPATTLANPSECIFFPD